VRLLTDEHRTILEKTMKNDASSRARARAHGLLLSGPGVTINAIAKMYHVDRDTVSTWITQWEYQGAASWHDQPRSGRPPKLTPEEQALALTYIQEEPRSLKQVGDRLAQKTAKRLRISALKRLAKRARLRWKRVRQSLQSLRDPEAFAQGQRALEAFQHQEDAGKIPRYYFDEAGCALDPSMPYAWQASGEVLDLPAMRYGRINVVGFMNRHTDLQAYMFEQSVHRGVVMACCDAFCQTITPKTVVVLDNASIHTSEEFEERMPCWRKQGLILQSLPPYSPELHLIEILWRHIKYRWIPFSASQCLNALIEALENILSNVGSKYQITFA